MVELAAKKKRKEMLLRIRRTVYNWLKCLICIFSYVTVLPQLSVSKIITCTMLVKTIIFAPVTVTDIK